MPDRSTGFAPDPAPRAVAADPVLCRRGLSVVVITHAPMRARRIADGGGVLPAGRSVGTGPVDDVVAPKRHPETRSFLLGDHG